MPSFEVGVDVLDADAGEVELRFAELVGIFADEDDAAIEAEDARSPRGVLPRERDVEGPLECRRRRRSVEGRVSRRTAPSDWKTFDGGGGEAAWARGGRRWRMRRGG